MVAVVFFFRPRLSVDRGTSLLLRRTVDIYPGFQDRKERKWREKKSDLSFSPTSLFKKGKTEKRNRSDHLGLDRDPFSQVGKYWHGWKPVKLVK
jgi:hypothetical protein